MKFGQLTDELVGQPVIFRARLHNMRPQGELSTLFRLADFRSFTGAKIVFLSFRQQTQTIQGVLVVSGERDEHQVSKQMLKFAQTVSVGQLGAPGLAMVRKAWPADGISQNPLCLLKA